MERLDPGLPGADFFAYNPAQRMRAWFSGTGVALDPTADGLPVGDRPGVSLVGVVRDGREQVVPAGWAVSHGNRVEIRREGECPVEWFENGREGLEHGFTLPDDRGATRELRLVLETVNARVEGRSGAGDGIRFVVSATGRALDYLGLKAWDADGRTLAARMERLSATSLALVVDVGHARYPVTVDPLFANVEARLTEESVASDAFGSCVAFDGETAVVGAPNDDSAAGFDTGSAYVFRRVGESWSLEAKLTGDDPATDDRFGSAVAVSGDTVVIGCHLDDTAAGYDAGSIHVYVRQAQRWERQAKLNPADAAGYDYFGSAVAVSGDRVLVGARGDAKSAGYDAGSAYVFAWNGSQWLQEAKLTALDAAADDRFGAAVALSGTTALIGAWGDDNGSAIDAGSAYVFTRSGNAWSQQAKLTAPDAASGDNLGNAVALDGDAAVVGAWGQDSPGQADAGAVHSFARAGTAWPHQAKLTAPVPAAGDYFGASIALAGDTAVIGSWADDTAAGSDAGSAFVFDRSSGSWTQQTMLTAGDAAAADKFGCAVALAGGIAVVGARADATPAGVNAGSVHVFSNTAGAWTQRATLLANDRPQGDKFGMAVAVAGDTVAIGAPDDGTATGTLAGACYLLERVANGWAQRAKLTAADGMAGDRFGSAVTVSGTSVVVGAPGDDEAAGADVGSVHVFVRGTTSWGLEQKLTDPGGSAGDGFGSAVAMTGSLVAVGAPADDHAAGANAGSVGVFLRDAGVWLWQGRLVATDAAADDRCGTSVAAWGDTILAGADGCDTSAGMNAGAAYLFLRSGSNWTQQAKLTATDGAAVDRFGCTVALDAGTALVGAWADDTVAGTDAGSAHVFALNGTAWLPQGKLTAADAAPADAFGTAVAISGEIAVVGAPFDASPAGLGTGAAYVFQRKAGAWQQHLKLTAGLDASVYDFFGASVAISGNTAVVGAPYEDHSGTDAGCAYQFVLGELPEILRQPESRVVNTHQPVAFTVVAGGMATLRFQWRKDGFEIPGATAAAYLITSAQVADQGLYDCVVSNSGGVVTSSAARLIVNDLCRTERIFPVGPDEAAGVVIVNLYPAGVGGWRFVGERQWRVSGVPVGALASGDRMVEFRVVPGYIQPAAEMVAVTSGAAASVLDRYYHESGAPDIGSLSIILKPESLAAPTVPEALRAQWRMLGEDDLQWRDSGEIRAGVAVGSHLIECKPVAGRVTPPAAVVEVSRNGTTLFTVTYAEAAAATGTAAALLAHEAVVEDVAFPYGLIGQLRTEAGQASGFVVKRRVVATAGHVVFDDGTLTAVTGLQWLFQRHRGIYEPAPKTPRGFYLFDGYSAQRAAENTPGTSSPQSQHLDVAALYFLEDAGRGGHSGYLASDLDENEFLLSGAEKLLAGYPVDGIAAAYQGRMHATPPMNAVFARGFGRTFITTSIRGSGGMSGGPLCMLHDNGHWYPAAIYLGGSGQTVVRAIDSQVIELFNRAEVSGNGGSNNTGGGITHTSVSGTLSATQPGSLRVLVEPAAARAAGAGWRLRPETAYRSSGSTKGSLRAGTYLLELSTVAGFQQPAEQSVTVTGGQLKTVVFSYAGALSPLEVWRGVNFGSVEDSGDAADTADPDGDGRKNLEEYVAGTDPKDGGDFLRLRSDRVSGASVRLSVAGKAGRRYLLQRNILPGGSEWVDVDTPQRVEVEETIEWVDVAAPTGAVFYRVVISLP